MKKFLLLGVLLSLVGCSQSVKKTAEHKTSSTTTHSTTKKKVDKTSSTETTKTTTQETTSTSTTETTSEEVDDQSVPQSLWGTWYRVDDSTQTLYFDQQTAGGSSYESISYLENGFIKFNRSNVARQLAVRIIQEATGEALEVAADGAPNATIQYTRTPTEKQPQAQAGQQSNFDILAYINTNYPLTGAHYQVGFANRNSQTGRDEYVITILPDDQENDQLLTGSLRTVENKTPEQTEISERIFQKARDIISILPKQDATIHIHHVGYVSYDGSYDLLLIQDRAQDTLKD